MGDVAPHWLGLHLLGRETLHERPAGELSQIAAVGSTRSRRTVAPREILVKQCDCLLPDTLKRGLWTFDGVLYWRTHPVA